MARTILFPGKGAYPYRYNLLNVFKLIMKYMPTRHAGVTTPLKRVVTRDIGLNPSIVQRRNLFQFIFHIICHIQPVHKLCNSLCVYLLIGAGKVF